MTNNPLVSIIINNYNYDRFLGEAIQSALDQDYPHTEIIVVDDGSTDASRQVIRRFQRENPGRVRAVLKENGGQASAFNAGFSASHGSLVSFLDSDDYWFRHRTTAVVDTHARAPVVQHGLLCQARRFRVLLQQGDLRRLLREQGLMRNCVPTSALSYHRDTIAGAFPLPEEPLRLCADSYVRNYAVYHHGIASVPDSLGVYRRHGDNRFHDHVRFQRPNIVDDIRLLLNAKLEAEGCTPIPLNPKAVEESFLRSFPVEAGRVYLVYGSGDLGRKVRARIEEQGGTVAGFVDRDPAKQAAKAGGLPVLAPEELPARRPAVHRIVIGTMFVESALEDLVELGMRPGDDILVPLDIEGRNEPASAPPRKRAVLFGASTLGEQAVKTLAREYEVVGFADNDRSKWGGTWAGRPVFPPEVIAYLGVQHVVITSAFHRDITKQLRELGHTASSIYSPSPPERRPPDAGQTTRPARCLCQPV